MLKTRVIPCLLLRGAGLVKTTGFNDPKYVGDPINAIKIFNDKEVDELVLLDIAASREDRGPAYSVIEEVASECFMPLAYGGGIRTVDEARRILKLGVEKAIFNTTAWREPSVLVGASREFGSQAVVASVDVRRGMFGRYEVFVEGGTRGTGVDPVDYARRMEDVGAGEILLTAIDRDGTMKGYDLELVAKVTAAVTVPVIAAGGAGSIRDFGIAIHKGGADAVAAGAMFVFHGPHRAVLITYPTRAELHEGPRMKRRNTRHLRMASLLVVLVVLGATFLGLVGIDALEGRNDFQFFADSNTYHEAARGELTHVEGIASTIRVAGNFLGPLLVLALAGENYYVVLLLNSLVMFFSVRSISNSLNLDSQRLLLVLLANPLTLSSLLSVNKEILSLGFVALLLSGFVRRSSFAMLVALGMSLLVRWQLTAYMVVMLGLASPWNPLRDRRVVSLLILLLFVSIAYVGLADVLEPARLNFESAAWEYEGSGVFQRLVDLQNRGFYWAVFPLKAAHLLFASGLRFDRLLNPEVIYNDIWQLLHSTMTLVLFIALWAKRRLIMANDLVYMSLVYVAVFAVTPIYASRYFYVVYVLWSIAITAHTARPAVFPVPQGSLRKQRAGELLPPPPIEDRTKVRS